MALRLYTPTASRPHRPAKLRQVMSNPILRPRLARDPDAPVSGPVYDRPVYDGPATLSYADGLAAELERIAIAIGLDGEGGAD